MTAETLTPPEEAFAEAELKQEMVPDVTLEDSVASRISDFEARTTSLTQEQKFTNQEAVARGFNLSPEQADTAIVNAEAMKATARVSIRLPRAAFDSMLDSGRYIPASERDHGTGVTSDVGARERVFERDNGLWHDGEPRVVYGYLDNFRDLEHKTPAFTYGNLALILKPEVAERSTFTYGDSLSGPKPLYNFDDAVIAKEARDIAEYGGGKNTPYVEAQILGGVTADDVEAASITLSKPREGAHFSGESSEKMEWQGIKELENFLETFTARYPDKPVVVRIPDDIDRGAFPTKKVLQLAERYPQGMFIAVIDRGSLPYQSNMHAARLEMNHGLDASDVRKVSDYHYRESQERRQQLNSALERRWKELGHDDKIPENMRVIVTESEVYGVG